MKRTAWLRKSLWITLIALLVLVAGGLIALRTYLASAAATRQVAERLQDMLGGRVEIQGAQIGLTGDSRVRGIQAYEEGEPNKPWLHIDDVTADVSALSLMRDKSPDDIQLQGAHIRLRFDRDGRLLTKLPSKKGAAPAQLPLIHIENGELTFDRENRTPMVVRGVHAQIASSANGLTLTGTVHDPFWGDWKVRGDFNSSGSKGSLTLDTEKVDVTMTKLRSIAFVPLSVWDAVHVEGVTPAQVRLDMETQNDKTSVRYRVEISPRDAHVLVPRIDLDATQASGKAIVADEIVELDNVHGKTAGGSISTSGKLNFHDEPTRLAFKAGVQDVLLRDLPRSWRIPNSIDGKLTGSADLVVTINKGKVQTSGSGEGVVRDAKWGGFSITKPVRLALRSEKGRFRFHRPEQSGLAEGQDGEVWTRSHYRSAEEESEPADEGDFFQNAPAELMNLLGRAIKMTADGLAKGIDTAADTLNKLKPPSKPGEAPTYLDVDLNLQNVDLAQLVQKLKLNLPYAVTGRLTFQVHASIPINTAGDLKAYRLRGTAKLPSFNVAGLAMTNVETKVRYAEGVLDLDNLKGEMPDPKDAKTMGKFTGDARVQVVPRGDLQATVKLDRVPLATLLSPLLGAKPQAALLGAKQQAALITSILSGTVQGRAPLMNLSDPASWRGVANLTAPEAEIYGVPLRNAVAGLVVDETRARLTSFKADLEGAALTGGGEMQLKGAYPFKVEAHLGRGELTTLHRLPSAFRPPFELKGHTQLDGTATGTLTPFQIDTTGKLRATDLVVEGFTMDNLSFRWSRDKDDLKLDAIKADLYGGEVTGTARLPLTATAPGSGDLRIRNLDVKAMGKALPAFPVRLEGKVSGTVKGTLAAAEGERPRTWTSDVEVTAPQLKVQGIPAEKLKGTIESRSGKAVYNLQGETLGGTFTLKGDLQTGKEKNKKPAEEPPAAQDGPDLLPVHAVEAARQPAAAETLGQGRFELREAQLSRVWAAYNITGGLSHLNGLFSIVINYRHVGPNLAPVGNGSFSIVNIGWDDDILGDSLQGSVRLTPTAFQLYNVTGDMAGGLFLGRFSFGLTATSRSWFQMELQQVDASRLFVPLPEVAPHIKGLVDWNLHGTIGREWDGSGGATLVRGKVYGMSITEWRIPMTFSFSPSQGTGELAVRDSEARLAGGRARYEGTLNWGNGLRLDGRLLFYQVDMRSLLREEPKLAAYASGRVSGRIDLAGSEMRSLSDLTAFVQAKMTQGQALQLPVLRHITPYLRPGASSSTFQTGELKGRLARGIFRIENATLAGEFIKLLILGTINLAGNLDLEVTAQTGLFVVNPTRAASLSSRIPLVGAIPRLLRFEANALLSAAVVHLNVTGTVQAPVIRLEPLVTLTEDAVRFFLGRAIGLAIPNIP
jgi:hypothetical protein